MISGLLLCFSSVLLLGLLCSMVQASSNISVPTAIPPSTAPPPLVDPFSLAKDWTGDMNLPFATAYTAALLHGARIAIVGGCLDVACVTLSRDTYLYDPSTAQGVFLVSLVYPIAGRHSTVSINSRLYSVHMCGLWPAAVPLDVTIINTIEVYDQSHSATVAFNTTGQFSTNSTRVNATCLPFHETIFVFGGFDITSGEPVSQVLAIDTSNYPTLTYFSGAPQNAPRLALMAGFSDSAALYLSGGIASVSEKKPQTTFYVAVPGLLANPLDSMCFSAIEHVISVPLAELEPMEFQIVGYASWFILKLGRYFATNLDVESCTAPQCTTKDWTIISNPPTHFSNTGYVPIEGTRIGASLLGFPSWTPSTGNGSAAIMSLYEFGGIATLNVTVYPTPAPPLPPTTTVAPTTTAAPSTTTPVPTTPPPPTSTEAPPTTEAPTTTEAPPTTTVTPTPSPNTTASALSLYPPVSPPDEPALIAHYLALLKRFVSLESTSATPETTAPPPPEPPSEVTYVNRTAVVSNVTVIRTNVVLPGLSFEQDPQWSITPTGGLLWDISADPQSYPLRINCPIDQPECGFFNTFCIGSNSEGVNQCNIGLFRDPGCRNVVASNFLGGKHYATLSTQNLGTGVQLWLCVTYTQITAGACSASFAYSVVNFQAPITVTGANSPTLAPPNPGGSDPTSPSFLVVGMAVLAAVLLVTLIGSVVWFRRRQAAAASAVAGRYLHLEEIGRGAFGKVIKVKRISDNEIFAMKHIDCPSAEVLQEALKEFELLRKLQAHPNIIRVVDMFLNYEVVGSALGASDAAPNRRDSALRGSGQSNNNNSPTRHLCIVMDYHPSKDLKLWALALPGPIPEPVLCHIAVQTCSVLSFIHERNIIHRDLKPENILIVRDERLDVAGGTRASRGSNSFLQPVVITDFGLAHFVAESRSIGFVGTAVYSAPECVALLPKSGPSGEAAQANHTTEHDSAAPLLRRETSVTYQSLRGFAGINIPGVTPRGTNRSTSESHRQAMAQGSVTSQCDLWSLGCVLYAAATKRMDRWTVRKMFEDVYMPTFTVDITADLRAAGYSPALAAFILRLLKVRPEERPTAKDALKYFRKSNRDQSYHVTETQKLTAEERRRMAAAAAARTAPLGATPDAPRKHPNTQQQTAPSASPVKAELRQSSPPDVRGDARVVTFPAANGSKREARNSSDGEKESLHTRRSPTPSPRDPIEEEQQRVNNAEANTDSNPTCLQ